MWLNYGLLEALTGSDNEVVEDIFRSALLAVKSDEGRKKIWFEYLAWAKNGGAEAEILQIVDEGLADIPSDVVVPVSTHEPPYVIHNPDYLHLVTPFTFKDFTFHCALLEQYLSYIPDVRRRLVLERAIIRFRNQNIALAMRAAEQEIVMNNFNRAKSYLFSAVKNPPFGSDTESCWLKLAALPGPAPQQRQVLQHAVASLPMSAAIWACYLAFEEKEGDSEIVSQICQQISQKGLKLT